MDVDDIIGEIVEESFSDEEVIGAFARLCNELGGDVILWDGSFAYHTVMPASRWLEERTLPVSRRSFGLHLNDGRAIIFSRKGDRWEAWENDDPIVW